jgi:transposase
LLILIPDKTGKLQSLSAIGRWVRAERGSAPATTEASSVLNLSGQAELRRLREENDQLRMEREILKKAAVFFAKEIE